MEAINRPNRQKIPVMHRDKFAAVCIHRQPSLFELRLAYASKTAEVPSYSGDEKGGPVKARGKNGVGDDVERPYPHGIGAQ